MEPYTDPARRRGKSAPTGVVRLRAIEKDDLPFLKEWRNEYKEFFREYRYLSDSHQEQWFASLINDRSCIHYAVDVADGGWYIIGTVNLTHIDWINRHAELGILIGEAEWQRKGVALKAMILIHEIAFYTLGMKSVRLEVYDYNERAVKLFEEFGYRFIGGIRCAKYHNGAYTNALIMDMLREEWATLYDEKYFRMLNPKPSQ